MALIKCSECNREVSDKASACLGCGAPIAAAGAGTPIQTIQKTSKRLKAQSLLSGILAAFGGLVVILSSIAASETHSPMPTFPIILFMAGFVWYVSVKIRIWWHHE